MPKGNTKTSKAKNTKDKKAKKDPNRPKRPPTPYFLYLNEHRASIKEEHPDAKVTEIAKIASEQWKALGEEEKKEYQTKADAAKEQYKKDIEKYDGKKQASEEEEEEEGDSE
ncbi:high mobility group hmg box domain containing protein [Entamoeba histolytica]|uniref:High mobility group (HMG) box domain containing protein n=3 Tax=Entamoeba histolytica TaxID=5759 RepID=C4LTF9_ENTH1|nr:high mobility group (HMG) box domain containing protein [Entamoeba histolytica HM-1:IMSS]EAL48200.1 high mobility group (HMG) box domain containing protein [Entamoeba histolytica HM-1:IMSS]EMD43706.1 high mobility group (HMG) box domain containing protein [Entamoeba histolytica KU27]GAT91847.1 high mobility group hmg box domain containing protein [Entamoeba histolytica]|eukprot:XP_653586.1 high mobility group (HMG) box domain containing protein [Entamoeba histolytica HM-1:IMSS]